MLATVKARKNVRRVMRLVLAYLLLVPLALIFVTPLLWLISTALKDDAQMGAWPPVLFPSPLRWDHFYTAWTAGNFGLYLRNTTLITVLASVGQVGTSSLVAFGFARLRFPGRDALFAVLLATLMLPGVVTLIPTFVLFKQLGWLNSFKPLIVPAYFGVGPFFIFLLRQFYKTLPQELAEAARIDGASNYRIYWQVMLPLIKPALSTVAIWAFMGSWNDFMAPLIYLSSPEKFTLTLGLRLFMTNTQTRFQEMMAMALLMTLPVIVVFFAFQQYFIQGVVMSGIKA